MPDMLLTCHLHATYSLITNCTYVSLMRDLHTYFYIDAIQTIYVVPATYKCCSWLQGSNAELRDRLHELSAQAEAAKAQLTALEGLQSSLQDSAGPSVDAWVEAAVGRERAIQDARNQKVLELLNNKVSYASTGGGACAIASCLYRQQAQGFAFSLMHVCWSCA